MLQHIFLFTSSTSIFKNFNRPFAHVTSLGLFFLTVISFSADGFTGILHATESDERPITVGSKPFTENVILGEMLTQLVRSSQSEAVHQKELGGTRVLWNALLRGDIDVYAEYTGTITQELLAGQGMESDEEIAMAVAKHGLQMSKPIGFNNTYAIGMLESSAEALGIQTVSDLNQHPHLLFGFSNEFMDRGDGWPSLRDAYRMPHKKVRGLQHDLAYRGLENGSIDVMDLYSTDAEIQYYSLRTLHDNLNHFPTYNAVILYRDDLAERAPKSIASIRKLEGLISDQVMSGLNARAKIERVEETLVAAEFLRTALQTKTMVVESHVTDRLIQRTQEHLTLVLISLVAAILIAVPLGIISARAAQLGQVILSVTGAIQTIPSLALLVFMIPIFGINEPPAIAALFLYSLLPIVRNTYTGISDIPTTMRESAEALGLPSSVRLRKVELPLASRSILAGIKTSAVINVGFATIGAFIGAGGYGQPILTGLRLDDLGLIMEGAIPAAILALVIQWLFEFSERWLVPKGLRLKPVE
tara:strand:+ start:3867 stop:5459 length:1593 start_codon:yes stop_codon:yes gene_type:complete